MPAARNYSSVARLSALTAGVSSAATTFPVDQTTGFPTIPFTLVVDAGRVAEEIVTVTSVIGLNLTVARGQDGSAAQPHDAGAAVRHMATARDFREPADHIALTTGVHGSTGTLVDTITAQTLDNKTFAAGLTDHVPLKVQAATGQTSNLLDVLSAGSAVIASIKSSGRISTIGVDGLSTSTFTAGTAATVPLIAKGTTSQSASVLSVRNSADTEVAGVNAGGTISGVAVNVFTVSATSAALTTVTSTTTTSGSLTSTTHTNTGSATFTSSSGTTPLVAKQPAGQSANSLAVTDSSDAVRAGVGSASGGYQLFHGNSTNRVPFRLHAGSQLVTMGTGASSWGGTISFAGLGFDTAPLMMLTVRQDNESTLKRRVCVNLEGIPTTSSADFRVVQTTDTVMPDPTEYRVHWLAIQMTLTTAAG